MSNEHEAPESEFVRKWKHDSNATILQAVQIIATLTAERDKLNARHDQLVRLTSHVYSRFSVDLPHTFRAAIQSAATFEGRISELEAERPLPPLVALRCACTVEHEGTNIENWVMKLDCPVHKGIIEWARECAESATKGFEYAEEFRKERDALRTALEEVQLRARIMSVPDADCGEEVLRDVFRHIADIAREALGGKS